MKHTTWEGAAKQAIVFSHKLVNLSPVGFTSGLYNKGKAILKGVARGCSTLVFSVFHKLCVRGKWSDGDISLHQCHISLCSEWQCIFHGGKITSLIFPLSFKWGKENIECGPSLVLLYLITVYKAFSIQSTQLTFSRYNCLQHSCKVGQYYLHIADNGEGTEAERLRALSKTGEEIWTDLPEYNSLP